MPSKPLRFLYSKYAGQAPSAGDGNENAENGGPAGFHSSIPSNSKVSPETTATHGQLPRLGREFTKAERVNMYFAMSQNNYDGASQDYSSVGSASTNGRSAVSRRDRTLNVSPVRFRSKSQEFQSKYKLAVTRASPEQKNARLSQAEELIEVVELNKNGNTGSDGRLPLLSSNSKSSLEQNDGKVMEITMQTKNSLRKSVLPSKGLASHFNLTTNNMNIKINGDFKRPRSTNSCDSFESVQIRYQNDNSRKDAKDNNKHRLLIDKLPRCQSRSPADDDRLDSSHYQHLLNDFSSTSVSSFSSVKSDPASSQFSARAHRPSTTRTSSTNHRLRDIWAYSIDSDRLHGTTTKPKSRHNSVNNKSPETQWPPRYSIIPSWPSYEDIQTLNSCGDHQNIMAQLYRRENRWSKDRNSTLIYRNNHLTMKYPHAQQQPIHVVPSHTTMECAMCNLYNQRPVSTTCPPNSPLVNNHNHHHHHNHYDPESRLSNNYSTLVNHSTPTNNTAPSSVLSKRQTTPVLSREPSKLASFRKNSQYSAGDSSSSIPSRSVTASLYGKDKNNGTPAPTSKHVTFSGKSKVDKMSFTWDTCKVAYIKANV